MTTLRALLLVPIALLCQTQETKDQTPVDWKAAIDAEIYPRDIFAYFRAREHDLRGWKLAVQEQIVYAGSLDWETCIVTATKGTLVRYFWVYRASGVDPENEQSVDEIRVKQLDTPDEDPKRNRYSEKGEWDSEHYMHWVPASYDPKIGTCSSGLGGSMWFPATKKECFK